MFVDEIAKWVLEKINELDDELKVVDYCIGVRYSYVTVRGIKGQSMGLAFTPLEDVVYQPIARIPNVNSLLELVSSTSILDKVLGVALMNALSNYLLWCLNNTFGVSFLYNVNLIEKLEEFAKEPIIVIGNMKPLVKALQSENLKVIAVSERNPCYRQGALPDTLIARVIKHANTLIITGATLVNDTIDYILNLAEGKRVILVGPTAGAHPRAFIDNGIEVVASLSPRDIEKVKEIIKLGGGRWSFTGYCTQYIAY